MKSPACPECNNARVIDCPECNGGTDLCPACAGSGVYWVYDEQRPCKECRGAGELPCRACRATGSLPCPKCWEIA